MSQQITSKLSNTIFWLGIFAKINLFQKFTNRLHRKETRQVTWAANHSTGFIIRAVRESLK